MLNHLVMIKFRQDIDPAKIEELEERLEDLPNTINEIHSYEFGRDIIRSDRSYDFAIISLFANQDALRRYQTHPEHVKVLDLLKTICESIATVDFLGIDASDLREKPPGGFENLFKA
jgi:antibiotic biosynthesis monooxygenase (ABM) superfamily enzyme